MRAAKTKKHVQLSLDMARNPDRKHGGWRPNAGRPKKPGSISHRTRAYIASRFPQHVTLRITDGVAPIATQWLMRVIRECIRNAHKLTFRIVEFNVLANHLHLITEAASKESLQRGVQGFEVRVARRLNAAMGRRGQLFAHRYHARCLTTPTEVRHALRYVLQNRKHHAAEKKFNARWFDPCSSAAWFDGWATPLRGETHAQDEILAMAPPNRKATTWLLSVGWKRLGLLRLDEAPA